MSNVLITAPSLDEQVNISGISSLTKAIIRHNSQAQNYFHFSIGKKDAERKGMLWISNQLLLIPRFMVFVKKHKIDLVHLNTDLTPLSIFRDYMILMATHRLLKKRVLLHIHGGYLLMSPPKRSTLVYLLVKTMLRTATMSVVLSEIEQEKIFSSYRIRAAIVPNAVEILDPCPNKSFSGKIKLLFMGRIVKSKGIYLIADCLKEMTDYLDRIELSIYGTGVDLPNFLNELRAIKGLAFNYGGVAKGEKKHLAFSNADVFLLPSLYGEGLPIAMLESMNYGCVPVVSDDASIGSVVKNGHNGFLVNRGDLLQLKETLIDVIVNPGRLLKLSETAKETIKADYNLNNYLTSLNLIYKVGDQY